MTKTARRSLLPMTLALIFFAFAHTPAAAQSAPPVEDALFEKLRVSLASVDAHLDGVMGLAVKDLKTGRIIEMRGDVVFPQASSIKLALIYELYQKANAGRVDLGSLRALPKDRVGGSGVLPFLSEGAQLTVRDLAVLMMSLSDNAATNILIDEVTFTAVNSRMDSLGLMKTRFRRHMIDLPAARRGEENVSTPKEMLRLIEAIQKAAGLSAALAEDLHAVVSVPKQNAFRSALPESLLIYDKSGELEGVRTSTGLVVLKNRPYAVAIMTAALLKESDGDNAIREISRLVYETFDRLDRASPEGRLLGQ